ncbi:hypothetical protein GCM10011428_48070 [Streptomyces violaceus]
MFGLLPPSSSVTGMMFSLAYCMIRRPVVVSPVNATFATRGLGGERLARFDTEAVDHVDHARREQVGDQFDDVEQADRGLLGRLDDDAVAGGQRGGQLPSGHQDREVPRDDLADHAQWLVEVVRDRIGVDLRDAALLGADDAGEVPEVVHGQRDVGGQGLADRLAVLPGLGDRDLLEVFFQAVRDPVEDAGAFRGGRAAPPVGRPVRGVQGEFDVGGGGAGHLTEDLAGHGGRVLEVAALDRGDEVTADEVVVAPGEVDDAAVRSWLPRTPWRLSSVKGGEG